MQSEILIVVGGLSGLALATRLHAAGRDVRLIEARDRLGGRILSVDGFDLGPAWFWPGQPRIAALVDRLGLKRFDQYATGALIFEDERGVVERGRGWASMEGSWRLEGGMGDLIAALVREMPQDRVHLSSPVARIEQKDGGADIATTDGTAYRARHVVLALPPRLARRIAIAPALPIEALHAMAATPTWMAGQAKVIATYDRPFWREAGLSGDAMSRRGPMVEVHDASPAKGGPYALFGFIGVPVTARYDGEALKAAVRDQLGRIFGAEAARPSALLLKDWAFDAFTATDLDQRPLHSHPNHGLPEALSDPWNGRLLFSGTETAPRFGGYLEGALEAADRTLAALTRNEVISRP